MAKTINDFESHKVNPFLSDTLPHIKEKPDYRKYITSGSMRLLDSDSGETSQAYQIQISQKHVDTQEFTKVYAGTMKEAFGLKAAGQKVLLYLWEKKQKDSDVVEFNLTTCRQWCGFKSNQSVYSGLAQLLEKKFIAKTELHYKYFINPTMFFNGNRLRIVKEFIVAPKFKELPKGENI